MGTPLPLPKRWAVHPQIFGPFLLWPNGLMHQDATWYGCWPQLRGPCVKWRPSLPSRTKWAEAERPSQFSAHFYCAQTAGCIKLSLGMEVGRRCVRWGPCLPPHQKGDGAPSPISRVDVRISKLDRKCGAFPVVANFIALEQKIILVKPEVNRFRSGRDITD